MPDRVIVKGQIGNALESIAPDHILGVANDIFDEDSQMYQSEINRGSVVFTEGVYDVTTHNSGATFASLSALLNDPNINTLIPVSVRKGGMSIKFVSSIDNKYVQYLCKTQLFTVNVFDWEKVNLEEEVNEAELEAQSASIFLGGDCSVLQTLGNYYIYNGVVTTHTSQICKVIKVIKGQKFDVNFIGTATLRWGFFSNTPKEGDTAKSYGSTTSNMRAVIAEDNGYFAFSYAYTLVESISIIPYSKIEDIDSAIEEMDAEIDKLHDHEASYDTLNNAYILDGVVTSHTSQSTFYKLFERGTKLCVKVNVNTLSTLRWGIFSQVPAINLQAIEYGSVGVSSYYEFNYVLSQDAYFACSLVTQNITSVVFEVNGELLSREDVVQQKGNSEVYVMSQKTVTDELNDLDAEDKNIDERLTATTEYLLGSAYNPKLLGNFYVLNGVITVQTEQTCKYFKVLKGQKFGIIFSLIGTSDINIRWGLFNDIPEVGSTAIKYGQNFKNGATIVAPSDGYFAFSYAYTLVESISIVPYSKIEETDSAIDDIIEITGIAKHPIEMPSGYFYRLSSLNVGDTFNEDGGSAPSYKSAKLKCKAGDKFTLNATAGSTAGLYCFVDSNNVVLSVQHGSITVTDLVVVAPTGAVYCYLNDNSNSTSYFERVGEYANIEQEIKRIDSKNHFNGLSSDFSLSASASKTLGTTYIRKNSRVSLEVRTFTSLRFGLGYQSYMGYWIEINSTTVSVYQYVSAATLVTSYEHGLDISSGIRASIVAAEETASIILVDAFGTVSKTDNINWWGGGAAFVTNLGSNIIEGNLTYIAGDITKKIWMFGDSYFSYNQNARWLHYMLEWNFKNWLANHLPGINSVNSITAFDNLKNLAIPTYIVWGLGMNDSADSDANTPSSAWLSSVEHIIEYCEHNAIEPILCTIPSVPTKLHEGKNNWIRNSGYRYIDFAKAVNAQSDGTWTEGLISGDGVHPSVAGAKVLASQVLIDFPEIMLD